MPLRVRGLPVVVGKLDLYPFPLAYPAHLARTAREPADRLDQAQHFIEMAAVTLGVLVLGWCRTHDAATEAVQNWEKTVERKGAALGGWTVLLKSARPELTASPDALGRSIALAIDGAYQRLDGFTHTRNQFAHGGRPRVRGEVDTAVGDLTHRASTLLDSMESLHNVRIAVVKSCLPGPGGAFEADLDVLMGYAEAPTPQKLTARRRFEDGAVIAYTNGRLDLAADLTPYCLYRRCDVCGRDELFYLVRRRKNRADHFTFANGHELKVGRDRSSELRQPLAALGMEPLTARRTEAARGWRALWLDLAPRRIRLAARAFDLAITATIGLSVWLLASLTGLGTKPSALLALTAILAHEPVGALRGGTLGKHLLRIEAISVWDARPLNSVDALFRALCIDLQIVVPPIAVYSLAWITWDPARQGFHDRVARSIVVAGRSTSGHKV